MIRPRNAGGRVRPLDSHGTVAYTPSGAAAGTSRHGRHGGIRAVDSAFPHPSSGLEEIPMRNRLALTIAVLSVAALGAARNGSSTRPVPSRDDHEAKEAKTLAAFDTMYGVDGPFVGDAFPIRDIPGDELPWTVREAQGRLDTDGHLTIRVRGLVFTDDPEVPPDLRGKNDETEFRGR